MSLRVGLGTAITDQAYAAGGGAAPGALEARYWRVKIIGSGLQDHSAMAQFVPVFGGGNSPTITASETGAGAVANLSDSSQSTKWETPANYSYVYLTMDLGSGVTDTLTAFKLQQTNEGDAVNAHPAALQIQYSTAAPPTVDADWVDYCVRLTQVSGVSSALVTYAINADCQTGVDYFLSPQQRWGVMLNRPVPRPGDALYLTNTTLLVQGGGADASATFTDGSNSAHTVTANGNVQMDDAVQPYGQTSILFDGTGDYLSIPDSADFDLAGGDWTIEATVQPSGFISNHAIIGQWLAAGSQLSWLFRYAVGGTGWQFFYSTDGATSSSNTFGGSMSLGTVYKIQLKRSGDAISLFVNGAQVGSTWNLTGSPVFHNSTTSVLIGSQSGGDFMEGWMDNIRLTKGSARATNVPYALFATQVADIDNAMADAEWQDAAGAALGTVSSNITKSATLNFTNLYDGSTATETNFEGEKHPQIFASEFTAAIEVKLLDLTAPATAAQAWTDFAVVAGPTDGCLQIISEVRPIWSITNEVKVIDVREPRFVSRNAIANYKAGDFTVSQWTDSAVYLGTARHLVQATGANQPSVLSSPARLHFDNPDVSNKEGMRAVFSATPGRSVLMIFQRPTTNWTGYGGGTFPNRRTIFRTNNSLTDDELRGDSGLQSLELMTGELTEDQRDFYDGTAWLGGNPDAAAIGNIAANTWVALLGTNDDVSTTITTVNIAYDGNFGTGGSTSTVDWGYLCILDNTDIRKNGPWKQMQKYALRILAELNA